MAFLDDMQSWMQDAAKQFGVSPSYLATTAKLESGNNPDAPGGGLFQFRGPAMVDVGLSNPLDPKASTFGAASLAASNTAFLSNALGRAPKDWEVYLAHQQGATGAANILSNPGQYADTGVANFKGNVNASEFKRLTGLDINNPFRPITNSDFAGYWQKKYQAASGETSSSFNIPALGGGSSEYKTAAATAAFAAAANPAAAAAMAVAGQGGSGGDTSTWMAWIEHQAVRGAVVFTGFIFLGVGLGLFALSAVFRSDVGRTVAGAYIGGAVAGRAARGNATPPPEGPTPDIEPVRLERVESGGSNLPILDVIPDAPNLVPPSAAEIEEALSGLTLREKPATEIAPKPQPLEQIFQDMEFAMRDYRRKMEVQPITNAPGERSIHGEPISNPSRRNLDVEKRFAPKAKKPPVELATAEATTPTGRRKKGKDFLGESVITAAGRRRIAQGWNDYVGLARKAKAAETGATAASVKRASKKSKTAEPPNVPIQLPEFEGFKVGKFAVLKDPKGQGRTNEPLLITAIWKDTKGVGISVKGEKSGKGMFPVSELEKASPKVARQGRQGKLLKALDVLRDFTKPKK